MIPDHKIEYREDLPDGCGTPGCHCTEVLVNCQQCRIPSQIVLETKQGLAMAVCPRCKAVISAFSIEPREREPS